jgi:hypothetical protein
MEKTSQNILRGANVLVIRKEMTLAIKVYRKLNHIGQYLSSHLHNIFFQDVF